MRISKFVAPVVLALCGLSPAFGAAIPPGSVLIPAAAETDPTGGSIIASTTTNFAIPGSLSGTLTSEVISGDPSNPHGGLTFSYLLTNDGVAGPNSIGRLSIADYISFVVDGNYQTPAVGVAPASIDRNPTGDVVGFNFVPIPALDPATGFLNPGLSSARLILQTNAPSYVDGLASVIDGGVTTTGTYVPAVPEPNSLLLLGLGTVMTLASRRRRG